MMTISNYERVKLWGFWRANNDGKGEVLVVIPITIAVSHRKRPDSACRLNLKVKMLHAWLIHQGANLLQHRLAPCEDNVRAFTAPCFGQDNGCQAI
jgi:hypothetical protein